MSGHRSYDYGKTWTQIHGSEPKEGAGMLRAFKMLWWTLCFEWYARRARVAWVNTICFRHMRDSYAERMSAEAQSAASPKGSGDDQPGNSKA